MTKAIIKSTHADLRRQPEGFSSSYEKDSLQESQLLYGEEVIIKEKQWEWAYVEAIEQPRFKDVWTGYPGWVKISDISEIKNWSPNASTINLWTEVFADQKTFLSLGSFLEVVEEDQQLAKVRLVNGNFGYVKKNALRLFNEKVLSQDVREHILQLAHQFIGNPYLWGGRSAYKLEFFPKTSIDCSGLISLLYRVFGIIIPRDAKDQFLQFEKKEYPQLKKGDLIFKASKETSKIEHVMLFEEGDSFIDANITDGKVVKTTGEKRFGKPFRNISWGETVGPFSLYFGSLKK